jgi:hypothetical protein
MCAQTTPKLLTSQKVKRMLLGGYGGYSQLLSVVIILSLNEQLHDFVSK